MRHKSAVKSLSRKSAHRAATMRNYGHQSRRARPHPYDGAEGQGRASPLAEQLITLGKKGTPHHRRLAISELGSTSQAKKTVKKIFSELTERFQAALGGYTRILRLPTTIRQVKGDLPRGNKINRSKFYGTRLGDNSTLVLWELCEAEMVKRERRAARRAVERHQTQGAQEEEAEGQRADRSGQDGPGDRRQADRRRSQGVVRQDTEIDGTKSPG